jgi:SAM-dependent methyltransferase
VTVRYSQAQAQEYDAEYAKIRDPSGDREFYAALAREQAQRLGKPVLEIGCGTGRVLLPIAKSGVECVGLDPSPAMLDVFRKKEPPANLTLVSGDAQTFDFLPKQFALIIAAFRVFQHFLSVEEQLTVLANVRRHLAPGGVFAFDLFEPDLARVAAAHEPEKEDVRTQDGDVETRRIVSVDRDHVTQVMNVVFRHERWQSDRKIGEEISSTAMRWFYRFEVEHLLARAGFEVAALYGGFARQPYDAKREMIFVARASIPS